MTERNHNLILPLCGLKALALLAIFVWHSTLPKPDIDIGARCCEFFFVVSGFLVAYNFYKKEFVFNISEMLSYTKRKFLDLYPLHILTFIISLIFFAKFRFETAIFNILLLQSWSCNDLIYFGYNGISWFISSLLFCYFMSPLLMNFVEVKNVRKTMFFLLGMILFRVLIELPLFHINCNIIYHINPIVRCLEFFIGMLVLPIYLHLKNTIQIRKNTKLIFSVIEILYVFILFNVWKYTNFIRGAYIPLISILILIFSMNLGFVSKLLSVNIFRKFSYIELEFFMFHQLVIKFFNMYLYISTNAYLNNIIAFATVIILSCCYKYLSKIFQENLFCNNEKSL